MPELAESTSPQHLVPFIHEELGSKSLHFSLDQLQSKMNNSDPDELALDYTKTMMGFLLLNSQPKHIAMIGLGGGSLAKFCYKNLPETKMTVVEINPHVIALRKDFLVPDDDERFKVIEADGADFVRDAEPEFDVLLVDGFDLEGQAPQLGSQQFYENCNRVLVDQGILAVNLHTFLPTYSLFVDRIDRSFDSNIAEVSAQRDGNTIVFAGKNMALSAHALRAKLHTRHVAVNRLKSLKNVFQQIIWDWQARKTE